MALADYFVYVPQVFGEGYWAVAVRVEGAESEGLEGGMMIVLVGWVCGAIGDGGGWGGRCRRDGFFGCDGWVDGLAGVEEEVLVC